MMAASSSHQKQKLTLLKPRRLARSIVGQFIPLPESPLKRLGLVSIGMLTGVGVPALVFASQQQTAPEKAQSTSSSTVHVQSTASSDQEGAVSQSETSLSSSASSDATTDTSVVVNGQTIPVPEGSSHTHVVNQDESQLDINIIVDRTTTGTSSNNSTSIIIDSSSSTDSGQNPVRGSPRR